MDIEIYTPSIRQNGAMNCTFFSAVFVCRAVFANRLIDQVLARINQYLKFPDRFKCSWYVLVNYQQKCDDNQITDNLTTAPPHANPVSGDFYNGGYHE